MFDSIHSHRHDDVIIFYFKVSRALSTFALPSRTRLLDARDEDLPYLMTYSAVCMYANEDSSTFHEYHLTYEAIRDGDEEIETEGGNRYTKTTPDEWDQVTVEDGEDGGGRTIDPI
jgi:hypothetical protein